ncbi:restriction endonuclease subunit S [Streptomyces sp. NPDC087568]|uniref:restriction endonuclease subunit S n=1 Tax=unclassified Streptomyces TaxID=2593676 RepID=UPI0038193B35
MNLNLDKSAWKRVALGDVAKHVTDRVDAETSGLERFLAGEHIPSNDLAITQWGVIGRDPIGPMFYKRFRPGHVLYVSRRSYLRKTAVPEFEGITGEKTFVLESRDESVLLQRFLPFVLSAEVFHSYAVANSRGSVNPYINWTELANYEFDLPPLDEQKRLADLLWALERHRGALIEELRCISIARDRMIEAGLPQEATMVPLSAAASIRSGITLGPARRDLPATAPYLRVANVQRGSLDLSEMKEVGATEAEVSTKGVTRGDVLVVEGHASVEEIGRAAIWDSGESPLFQNHLFRVRAAESFRPRYLLEWINSAAGRSYVRTVAKSTSGLNTINSTVLKAMPVPASPLSVQDALLEQLAVVDLSRRQVSDAESSLLRVRATLADEIFGGAE